MVVATGGGSTGNGKFGTIGFPGREGLGSEKDGGNGTLGTVGRSGENGEVGSLGNPGPPGNGSIRRRRDEKASL